MINKQIVRLQIRNTVYDLINEHPLISGHPRFLLAEIIALLHAIVI